MKKSSQLCALCACILLTVMANAHAATINFSGNLDVYLSDLTGAIYSGSDEFTNFFGSFDTATVNGYISDGTTSTSIGCCIAAGGFSINNSYVLPAAEATFYNDVLGTNRFTGGDTIVTVDIEGDAATSGGGRIEVGLNFILDENSITDPDPNNSPFNSNDVVLALFFIVEEGDTGDIFDAVGQLDTFTVPLPAAIWLFGAGLLGLLGIARRRKVA